MDILEKIIAHKRQEVENNKSIYPVKLLEQSLHFAAPTVSMKSYIRNPEKSGIIAEFKRQSPSKGVINEFAEVEKTTIGYMQSGASALSVLTDTQFFAGKNEDLQVARKYNYCPILRKDFTIDEYQIIEAKSIGADAILLISAVLTPDEIKRFSELAQSLHMEVLMEVHKKEELNDKLLDSLDLIGVNNRNLKTFEVSLEHSKTIAPLIPDQFVKISESGLKSPKELMELLPFGFEGFLMGQQFMEQSRPSQACFDFVQRYMNLKKDYHANA